MRVVGSDSYALLLLRVQNGHCHCMYTSSASAMRNVDFRTFQYACYFKSNRCLQAAAAAVTATDEMADVGLRLSLEGSS